MLIDIDDRTTWPDAIANEAESWAERLVDSTDHVEDLAFDVDADDSFRQRLAGHRLVAYHSTRLLPHELNNVREVGLVVSSQEFLTPIRAGCKGVANLGHGGVSSSHNMRRATQRAAHARRRVTVAVPTRATLPGRLARH
jgi:hypothetical protein